MDYSSVAAAEAAGRSPKSFENTQWKGYMPNAANAPQAAPAPSKAPDMSAYRFQPPSGARANDLSGQVPANQMWAQAYNQASKQYGGNTQVQSWTMPGSYSSQSFNPLSGAASKPTTGTSWDGNLAYSPIDSRPNPITATATGIDGSKMGWQDTFAQRDAFAGNLINRLNQYNGGQLSGPPTFNPNELLAQANDQLKDGSWSNPFMQTFSAPPVQASSTTQTTRSYGPAVDGAMQQATPYMRGSQWQNPFGQQATLPQPSWNQIAPGLQASDGGEEWNDAIQPPPQRPFASEDQWRRYLGGDWVSQQAHDDYYNQGVQRGYQYQPGAAQPKQPQSTGTPYAPRKALGNGAAWAY